MARLEKLGACRELGSGATGALFYGCKEAGGPALADWRRSTYLTVQALRFAHGQRVVHHDIKPALRGARAQVRPL